MAWKNPETGNVVKRNPDGTWGSKNSTDEQMEAAGYVWTENSQTSSSVSTRMLKPYEAPASSSSVAVPNFDMNASLDENIEVAKRKAKQIKNDPAEAHKATKAVIGYMQEHFWELLPRALAKTFIPISSAAYEDDVDMYAQIGATVGDLAFLVFSPARISYTGARAVTQGGLAGKRAAAISKKLAQADNSTLGTLATNITLGAVDGVAQTAGIKMFDDDGMLNEFGDYVFSGVLGGTFGALQGGINKARSHGAKEKLSARINTQGELNPNSKTSRKIDSYEAMTESSGDRRSSDIYFDDIIPEHSIFSSVESIANAEARGAEDALKKTGIAKRNFKRNNTMEVDYIDESGIVRTDRPDVDYDPRKKPIANANKGLEDIDVRNAVKLDDILDEVRFPSETGRETNREVLSKMKQTLADEYGENVNGIIYIPHEKLPEIRTQMRKDASYYDSEHSLNSTMNKQMSQLAYEATGEIQKKLAKSDPSMEALRNANEHAAVMGLRAEIARRPSSTIGKLPTIPMFGTRPQIQTSPNLGFFNPLPNAAAVMGRGLKNTLNEKQRKENEKKIAAEAIARADEMADKMGWKKEGKEWQEFVKTYILGENVPIEIVGYSSQPKVK